MKTTANTSAEVAWTAHRGARSRWVLLVGGALGLLWTMALLGASGGSCVPTDGDAPPAECTTAADCGEFAHDACEGHAVCAAGACEWVCDTVPPVACFDDAGCAEGLVCRFAFPDSGVLDCCLPGQLCLMIYPPCEGTCGAPLPPAGCATDADCARGEICRVEMVQGRAVGTCVGGVPAYPLCFGDADCRAGEWCDFSTCAYPDCAPGMDCSADADMACLGTCRPREEPSECASDSDCPAGYRCEFYATMLPPCDPADPTCGGPRPTGQCVPVEEPIPCWGDQYCPEGFRCEFFYAKRPACDPADPDCGAAEPPDGVCVPIAPAGCASDADCLPGYHCEFYEEAADPTDGDMARPVAWGVCVPDEEPLWCWGDADCPRGYRCELGADAPAEGMDRIAPPPGRCVADVPPPAECWSDADCPVGHICQFSYAPAAGDGEDGVALDPMVVGQCVPTEEPPVTCWSDADCAPGFVCDFSLGCGDGFAPADPAVPYPCGGVCRPAEEPRICGSDADCGPGYRCSWDFGCGGTAKLWCPGICVPDEVPPADCGADWHCAADERCEVDFAACPLFCDAETGRCGCGGTCVPIKHCLSDDDCPGSTYCHRDCPMLAPCPPDVEDCRPPLCVGECRDLPLTP